MRILGIDCGSRITGYGVIESDGRSQQAVSFGAIRLPEKRTLGERLATLADRLDGLVESFHPDEAAVEDVFTHLNVRSAIVLAHVRGVALLSASRAGLPVSSYSPAQVKNSVVGYGNAGKDQVRLMVKALLGVREEIDPPDISDALAVAYCHASLRDAVGRKG